MDTDRFPPYSQASTSRFAGLTTRPPGGGKANQRRTTFVMGHVAERVGGDADPQSIMWDCKVKISDRDNGVVLVSGEGDSQKAQ